MTNYLHEPTGNERYARDSALHTFVLVSGRQLDSLSAQIGWGNQLQGENGELLIREATKVFEEGDRAVKEVVHGYIYGDLSSSYYSAEKKAGIMGSLSGVAEAYIKMPPNQRPHLPYPGTAEYNRYPLFNDALTLYRFRDELDNTIGHQYSVILPRGSSRSFGDAMSLVSDAACWRQIMACRTLEGKAAEMFAKTHGGMKPNEAVDYALGNMSFSARQVAISLVDYVPVQQWKNARLDKDPMERRKAKRRRVTGLVATAAAAATVVALFNGNATKAKSENAPGPTVPPATAPVTPGQGEKISPTTSKANEKVEEGICLSEAANKLLETDCLKLPSFAEGGTYTKIGRADYTGEDDPRLKVGEINKGKYDIATLPRAYQDALRAAMQDPFVGYINSGKNSVPYGIYQTPATWRENGQYTPWDNSIRLIFYAGGEPSDTLYPTYGSVRSTLVHEGGHAEFQRWYDDAETDRITRKNVQAMTQVCVADLTDALAETQHTHGAEMTTTIQDIEQLIKNNKSSFTVKSYEDFLKNARELKNALKSGKNYATSRLTVNDYEMGCGVLAPSGLLVKSFTEEELKNFDNWISEGSTELQKKFHELASRLDDFQQKEVADYLQFTTEGVVADGLESDDAGHPDSVTERAASTISLIQEAPDEYAKRMNRLPDERRRRGKVFVEKLYEQMKHEAPEVAKAMNFEYVLSLINS